MLRCVLYISKSYIVYCGPQIGIHSCSAKGLTMLEHIGGGVRKWAHMNLSLNYNQNMVTSKTKVSSKVQVLIIRGVYMISTVLSQSAVSILTVVFAQ